MSNINSVGLSINESSNSSAQHYSCSPGQNGGFQKISFLETSNSSRDLKCLFSSLNKRFFWNHLSKVEVYWSNRMTSCAGTCLYKRKVNYCCIRLSAPLLKLRPHSDLVDTLLHEMIHAYLFLTSNDRSRDGHGPNFHKHKDRINKEAGTNITVYHSFHSEVKLYKQHWWRCNGRCQNQPPYFGMVKRSMNRAPGPNDRWWSNHLFRCGGTYTKIREPIEYTKKKNKASGVTDQEPGKEYGLENIVGFVDLTSLGGPSPGSESKTGKRRGNQPVLGVIDLTDEPQKKKTKTKDEICKCPSCDKDVPRGSVSEHLESCEGLQDIFDIDFDVIGLDEWDNEDTLEDGNDGPNKTCQSCPICSSQIKEDLKTHVEDCLNNSGIINVFDEQNFTSDDRHEGGHSSIGLGNETSKKIKCCPICGIHIQGDVDVHVDNCLNVSVDLSNEEWPTSDGDSAIKVSDAKACGPQNDSSGEDKAKFKTSQICPVCNKNIESDLEVHVNDCLNNSVSSSDFDDPVIDLSDFDSPVKGNKICKSKTNRYSSNNNKGPCPVCGKYVKTNLNVHLENCLNDSCSIVSFEEPVVEISDGESPVKILDIKFKVPMPKVGFNNNNEESESRVACRVCGMRYGVSKFNGHVCYPFQL